MILPNHDGRRPDADGDKYKDICMYCKTVDDGTHPHTPDCVCMVKTVVLEFTTRVVYTCPQSWDKDQIEFHVNESSSCMNNILEQIVEEVGMGESSGPCLCFRGHTALSYLDDATEQDHQVLQWRDDHG